MDSKQSNKLTAFIAAAFGLIMYLVSISPQLQAGIDQIAEKFIVLVPVEYQLAVKTVLVGIGVIVAIIVYVYNYTTSKQYANDKATYALINNAEECNANDAVDPTEIAADEMEKQ